jgi:hypothetical protein
LEQYEIYIFFHRTKMQICLNVKCVIMLIHLTLCTYCNVTLGGRNGEVHKVDLVFDATLLEKV